jgi:geranylgeranyl diphosphate synthase type I
MFDSKKDISQVYLAAIEEELQQSVTRTRDHYTSQLYKMLTYHMGWQGKPIKAEARGKRIRPLLVLLVCSTAGGDWEKALPAAAAVEMVHNFSLIHDDIEDNSSLRRGRETVWKKWGIPQAINAGDLMLTIAHLCGLEHNKNLNEKIMNEGSRLLQQTCVHLTQGQYLDMMLEGEENVSMQDYLRMIKGKTAALISCSAELGAIKMPKEIRDAFKNFGLQLGYAFQIQDDILGLWGETSVTGKSTDSDLVSRKKTFPILHALQNNLNFRNRWEGGMISAREAGELSNQLKQDGTYSYTKSMVNNFTQNAIQQLISTGFSNNAITSLQEITEQLLERSF